MEDLILALNIVKVNIVIPLSIKNIEIWLIYNLGWQKFGEIEL